MQEAFRKVSLLPAFSVPYLLRSRCADHAISPIVSRVVLHSDVARMAHSIRRNYVSDNEDQRQIRHQIWHKAIDTYCTRFLSIDHLKDISNSFLRVH